MTHKKSLIDTHNKYIQSFQELEKNNSFTKNFYDSFLIGDTKIYQKYIKETKNFDEEWIKTVESYFPSLNKIILNPKSSLKLEEEVVAIEKAKKINSQSIRHLSANTHLIKDVRNDGSVVPKKILTNYPEIDYGLYENRFIMTLIDRLFIFVRKRYEIIKENIKSLEKTQFNLESKFPINNTNVYLNMEMILEDEIENKKLNEYNQKLLERVENLNKLITSLKTSNFMELMKNQKKVHAPIMKTNIILKDVDYKNAYMLWLFLDRYNTLAYTLEVEEKNLKLTEQYIKDINRQALATFMTITSNQEKLLNKHNFINEVKKEYQSVSEVLEHPDEIEFNFEDEIVEDQAINEYYLEASKKIFEKSLQYHEATTKTYETSLKRALRDTLKITNALFESFFELKEDDDIFNRLVEDDINDELKEARKKQMIAKMIREVKEVDYNNTLRLERRLLLEISNLSNQIIKEYKENKQLAKEELIKLKELENEKKLAELQREKLKEELELVKSKNEEINNERIKANEKINTLIKSLKEEQEQELKQISQQYRKEFNNLSKSLKEEFDKTINEKLTILNNEQKEIITNLELELKKIDLEYKKEFLKEKLRLEKEHKNNLKREKNKITKRSKAKLEKLTEEEKSLILKAHKLRESRRNLNKIKNERLLKELEEKHLEEIRMLKYEEIF